METQSVRNGSGAASPSAKSSTAPGSESEAPSVPADALALIERLLGVGALSVVYVRDGVRLISDGGSDWTFGPAQWLLVQLPLGGMLPDGAFIRAQKES